MTFCFLGKTAHWAFLKTAHGAFLKIVRHAGDHAARPAARAVRHAGHYAARYAAGPVLLFATSGTIQRACCLTSPGTVLRALRPARRAARPVDGPVRHAGHHAAHHPALLLALPVAPCSLRTRLNCAGNGVATLSLLFAILLHVTTLCISVLYHLFFHEDSVFTFIYIE